MQKKAQITIEEKLSVLDAENSNKYLEEMLLKNKIAFSKSYVQNISLENDITLLTEKGIHKQIIDSNDHSSHFSEIFTKKNISLFESYSASLSIPSDAISYSINEENGDVSITYNKEDIDIFSVEITNSTFIENNIFYRSYNKTEYEATKSIGLQEIKKEFKSEKNLEKANESLIKFLVKDAKNHGIPKVIINGEPYNLTFLS